MTPGPWRGRLAGGCLLLGLLVALLPHVWPWACPASCQGGGAYAHLLGLPMTVWAMAGISAALLLMIRHAPWASAATGLLAGAALFHHLIGWALGMSCVLCWTLQGLLVLAAGLLARWPITPLVVLIGLLGTNAIRHHQVLRDVPLPQTPVVTHAPTADPFPGRTRGPATARWEVDLVIDLRCDHCAALRRPLLQALEGARITEHLVARPSDPLGRRLAIAGLAAAAQGPADWERYLARMLGTPREAHLDEVEEAHGALLRRLEAHLPTAQALRDADAAVMRCGYNGATPYLRVRDTAQGKTYHAQGNIDVEEVALWITQTP